MQCAIKQRLKTVHFPPLTASKSTPTNTASAIYCTSTSPRLSPLLALFTLRTFFFFFKKKRKTLLSEKSPSGQKNFINKHVAGSRGQTAMLFPLDSLKKKKKKKLPNVPAFVIRGPWWAPSDRALKRYDCGGSSGVLQRPLPTSAGSRRRLINRRSPFHTAVPAKGATTDVIDYPSRRVRSPLLWRNV